MSTWKARLGKRLTFPSTRMHPFPCSALLTCFGTTRENTPFDQSSVTETHSTIYGQPTAKVGQQPSHPRGTEGLSEQKPYSGTFSERNGSANGDSSHHFAAETPEGLGSLDGETVAFQMSIPRPSIIEKPMEEEESREELKCLKSGQKTTPDSLLEDADPKDTYLIPRSIMAEPDYIEDDNPELIRPQKLVNPVKSSRNHQDLHRELLMNQKRGLAPQNKPELQKVMEKRKRDQVIKQKEEEAQKKKSDLEIELLKRQQKLEQLELEKQKLQEEQENAPEFVKVKGNLRRTGQEVPQVQES
ncbi:protein FAM107B isoform X1 [Erinaceus europaeus]|uniref:Protein FAM107B isoform X1 n=2 Tax=Erinaceus europaeus TaxID=9365 RepID=A0A1S3AAU7_ERIEU|nr:protein FAM107B isoform X1 [Erinaceus europaeus]